MLSSRGFSELPAGAVVPVFGDAVPSGNEPFEPGQRQSEPSEGTRATTRHAKLLWIEDDEAVLRWGVRFLQSEGFVVDTATTGASGLVLAIRGGYDLILLDWLLPDLTGEPFLRALRGAGLTLPVMVLTSNFTHGERAAAMTAGANSFESKPIRSAAFLRAIVQSLEITAPPGSLGVPRSTKDDPPFHRAWTTRALELLGAANEILASMLRMLGIPAVVCS